jgi:hypothetical protein
MGVQVPAALAVQLGDAACDEALAVATPVLRHTLRPYLPALDAAAAADVSATDATAEAAAAAAAAGLLGDEATAPGGPFPATDEQLRAMGPAVATLRFAPDSAAVRRWVTLLAAGPRWDEEEARAGVGRRAELAAALLALRQPPLRAAAYDQLVRCVTAAEPADPGARAMRRCPSPADTATRRRAGTRRGAGGTSS